ncbi:MAG: NYN domain-containing protein [Oscillospiraceae bacterium]|jgi:predicted RNA-binding protein with PIN domain|nr:NYN domain-containing protein [Oscillospiraceae bacterium]
MIPLLLVDGYNVIGQWARAKKEGWPIDQARERLANCLSEYAAFEGIEVALVFDATRSDRLTRTEERSGQLTVVFTRAGETADQYIERAADCAPRNRELRVASSDSVVQTIAFGRGAARIPARELILAIDQSRARQRSAISAPAVRGVKSYPIYQRLPPEQQAALEKLRRGE